MSPDLPATKQDLADLEARVKERLEQFDTRLTELEARLIEQMRDMQTEIIRGLEAFARGNFARMHNLENQ